MPSRSSKKKPALPDPAVLAFNIIRGVTGESPAPEAPADGKNPAAVALGRLGGMKGGKARAKKLTKSERSEIAALAAAARWSKHKKNTDGP